MAYTRRKEMNMDYTGGGAMEYRPQAAKGAAGKDRMGSTKGDVGMSPRASQGPGNHGEFVHKRARGKGISMKGDPVKGGGYA